MKRAARLAVLTVLSAAGCYFALNAIGPDLGSGSRVQAGEPAPSKGPPPLSLEGMLDEKLSDEAPTTPRDENTADNSACFVCHGNYDGEEMVTQHAVESTGCVDCHGQSIAHRNDEDNITPPDTMYARQDIAENCKECHETHDAPAGKVIARFMERCQSIREPDDLVCTDCHGAHRLRFRTVEWNKKTGELLIRPGE